MSLSRNISLLKWHSFLTKFMLYVSIMTAFFKSLSYTNTQIMLLFSAAMLTSFVFAIPAAYFSDTKGRKISLQIGSFCVCAGTLVIGLTNTFSLTLVGIILFGLSGAFRGASEKAMLYDTLLGLSLTHNHKKINSSITANSSWALAIASLLGAFIVKQFSLPLTFILSVIPFAGAFLCASLMVEPKHDQSTQNKSKLTSSLSTVFSDKLLLNIMLFYAVSMFFVDISQKFEQLYYLAANIDAFWFGIIFAVGALIGGLITHNAHRIEKKLGFIPGLIVIILLPVTLFIILGLFLSIWGIILFLIINSIWGFVNVFTDDAIQRRVNSNNRATVFAAKNNMYGIIYFIFPSILGYISDILPSANGIYVVMACSYAILIAYPSWYIIRNISRTHNY